MSDSDNSRPSTNFSSVILGIAIGAVVAYLFANKDGQKIKDQLLKEGARLLDEVSDKMKEVEEKVDQSQLKEELEEKIEEIPEHIEQIQKKGRRFFFRKHQSGES